MCGSLAASSSAKFSLCFVLWAVPPVPLDLSDALLLLILFWPLLAMGGTQTSWPFASRTVRASSKSIRCHLMGLDARRPLCYHSDSTACRSYVSYFGYRCSSSCSWIRWPRARLLEFSCIRMISHADPTVVARVDSVSSTQDDWAD